MANAASSVPPQAGRGRRFLLATAALLIAPLAFATAEVALRVVGFGEDERLFVEVADRPNFLEANPLTLLRYYGSNGAVPSWIDPIPFPAERAENTYRIVVQGGSTAAGYPYGRWGGLAGMLGDRLEATFPSVEIDVITTAMAAVNSFTLLDLADEIIEIEPDAVLIYVGHNEYLGILGVGSAFVGGGPRSTTLALIALRRLRLFQLMNRGVHALIDPFRGAGNASRTLFAAAARGSVIRFGSDEYRQGLDQFEANLAELLARYREAGVPVYLGTIAGNERDQPPFVGGPRPEVDRGVWDRQRDAVVAALGAGDDRAAEEAIAAWESLDPFAADPVFERARFEERHGRIDAARASYREARDLDALRFRAPGAMNDRIRSLAARYGATLVDVEAALREASPNGLLGESLFLEHVHPNAEGYFLLAGAYYDALRRDGRIGDWKDAPSEEAARRDMPITALDRLIAAYDIATLKAGFPFRETDEPFSMPEPTNEIERIAQALRREEVSWIDSMEALMQLHRAAGRDADAAVVARIVAQAYPTRYQPNYAAGMLLLAQGEPRRAERYLARSLQAKPASRESLEALVRAAVAIDERIGIERAIANLARVDPTNRFVRQYRSRMPGG